MTDMRDVLRLLQHIASRYGGQLAMAQRTTVAENECVVCVDVRDNVLVAGRERLNGMNAAIKQAVMGYFPDVDVQACDYQCMTSENLAHRVHKQFFKIREVA